MPAPLALRYAALIIAGPTGVGKSDLALSAAQMLNGEIVGADAFQIYRGLDRLTAKPSAHHRATVPHHLIDEIPLDAEFDVAQYLALAEACLRDIRSRGKVPIIVGGTGLYVRALLRGLATLPSGDAALRAELATLPLEELQRRLTERDPTAANWVDMQNPRRVTRALEVCLLSGRPFSSFRTEWDQPPAVEHGVVVTRPRDELCARIDARVQEMFASGVIDEVADAGEGLSATARQTLGWREIRLYLQGEITRETCIAAIQLATRQYARRQATWFRKETGLRSTAFENAVSALMEIAARLERSSATEA